MKTLIMDPISDEALAYAQERLQVVKWDQVTEEDFSDAEALIIRVYKVDKELIDKMPKLKIVAKHGVGTDSIDKVYARERGIIVTNTPHANSNAVAELVVGLAISCFRNLVRSNLEILNGYEGIAPQHLTGYELHGKTAGLIGLGNIGTKVANILKHGFNMEILVYDPFINKGDDNLYKLVDSLDDLLQKSDLVTLSIPLTEETRNLISKRELDLMKDNAVLLNTARGGIVNEEDLIEALKNKKIFAAGVDAFLEEPVTKNNPLVQQANLIACPHIGANTFDSLLNMGTGAVDEIVRLNSGEANISVVN